MEQKSHINNDLYINDDILYNILLNSDMDPLKILCQINVKA